MQMNYHHSFAKSLFRSSKKNEIRHSMSSTYGHHNITASKIIDFNYGELGGNSFCLMHGAYLTADSPISIWCPETSNQIFIAKFFGKNVKFSHNGIIEYPTENDFCLMLPSSDLYVSSSKNLSYIGLRIPITHELKSTRPALIDSALKLFSNAPSCILDHHARDMFNSVLLTNEILSVKDGKLSTYQQEVFRQFVITVLSESAKRLKNDFSGFAVNISYASENMVKCLKYIDENANKKISINDLCTISGLSEASLYRQFKSHLNYSPGSYCLLRRLTCARKFIQLQGSKAKITDTAMSFEFENFSRFSFQYKRAFGETPSETRAQSIATI